MGSVATGSALVYGVGAACAAVGYARLAPTAVHLSRDQDSLRARGSDLIVALRTAMPPRPGR